MDEGYTMKTTPIKALIAAGVMLAAPAMAQDASTVVATVNDKEITLGHVMAVRERLPEQYATLPADTLWDAIIGQLVQQEALAQDPRASETTRFTKSLENERRSLLASGVISRAARDAVTEEAVQAAYEAQYAADGTEREFNASHILVETEQEALDIIEELSGGANFAVVAREKSTGPSGPNGGELGWFGPGMMVEPFQAAVEEMEVGAVSAPVETQFGWHVIRLNDSRLKEAPDLESVREQIEGELQQDAITALIDGAVEAADVTRTSATEVDTSILNNFELLED